MKTRKAILSRFKITGKGKLKASHPGLNHILEKKSSGRKRHLKKRAACNATQAKKYKKMIGV